MKYVIGIDGGGSKTLGYIGNDSGFIMSKYVSGASNYHSIGIEKAKLVLKDVIDNLCSNVKISIDDISVISVGLAGLGREEDKIVIQNILSGIGFRNKVIMNSDAFTALVGSLGNKKGVVTICGTGSISMGMNSAKRVFRAGGWGHIISDEGSGYNIGVNCLKAVMKSYDSMEQFTILTEEVLSFLKLKSEEDIISYLYHEQRSKKDIALIAQIVFGAAEKNDIVANRIVDEAVSSLIDITKKVIEKIYKDNSKITVALDGGIFRNVDIVRKRFLNTMSTYYNNIEIINPLYDGAVGAFAIGMNELKSNFQMSDLIFNI